VLIDSRKAAATEPSAQVAISAEEQFLGEFAALAPYLWHRLPTLRTRSTAEARATALPSRTRRQDSSNQSGSKTISSRTFLRAWSQLWPPDESMFTLSYAMRASLDRDLLPVRL